MCILYRMECLNIRHMNSPSTGMGIYRHIDIDNYCECKKDVHYVCDV